MAFFRSIVDAIRADRTPYQPALLEFPSVDPFKLRKELRLEERGKARGSKDQPPAEQASFDEVEHEVITRVEQFRRDAQASLAANLEVYARRLSQLDNRKLLDAVDREFEDAVTDFKAGVRTDADRLFLLKDNVLKGEREYAVFRERHRLDRRPIYPAHRFKSFAIVLFIGLVETIANAFFFSLTHPRGWAGAIFESVFISFVNILIGSAAGYFLLRGCFARSSAVKLVSAVSLVAFVAFIAGFNIFAAHYRDAFAVLGPEVISGGRDIASAEALKRLRTHLWDLSGFQSYLMAIVGLIVAGAAMIKGFGLDDAVPGYGAVARHREAGIAKYASEKEFLMSGLKERKEEALTEIKYIMEEVGRRDEEYSAALEARRSLVQRFNSFSAHLESSANQLLEMYRGANRQARKTPAPEHFNRSWSPQWPREEPPADAPASMRDDANEKLRQRLREARRAFLAGFDEANEEYKRIDQFASTEAIEHARAKVA